MGMFDNITCKHPLPVAGANAMTFQTKDTPAQWLDHYEIREDGTLWHEDYDTEDQSDAAKWEQAHPGQQAPRELDAFCGCMTKVNQRWTQLTDFTGEICFYEILEPNGWIEFSAYFVNGHIKHIQLIEHTKGQ